MRHWIDQYEGLLWAAAFASLAVVIASAAAVPMLVVRIPPDYFAHAVRPPGPWANQYPLVRLAILLAKNVLGVLLMLAGVAMLLLPGQGLLTLLVGFFLVDFPGKYQMEKWLVARRNVHRPINWLRRRRGRAALVIGRSEP